ncbi:hypothetical protein BBP40_000252 [Aspergillus hancockii]|nr:hypothetical protein BBP40_000252 [Aspergillus hancockii]
MPLSQFERVAIIGGGCTGVTCFWALQYSLHDVYLFEASSSLGGRIKSLPFDHNGNEVDVNTELPSFNAEASPNLISLLQYLGISTSAIPFCFGVTNGVNTQTWFGGVLRTILLHPWMLCNPETYRILLDVTWLNYLAMDILMTEYQPTESNDAQQSLSTHDYLLKEGYSNILCDKYLAPLLSTLWGTNVGKLLPQFPVKALLNCLCDHKLFHTQRTTPNLRRIDAGTSHFIQSMASSFPSEKVHLDTRVQEIIRLGKKQYAISTADGTEMHFDHIVFAVDNDEILKILGSNMDAEEGGIIRGLRTTRNIAVLHSDPLLTPSMDRSWPAINYMIAPTQYGPISSPTRKSSLTYNVNSLQDIPICLFDRLFITLNPYTPPHPLFAHSVWEYTDPELSSTTLLAQSRLPSIQNKRGLSYGFRWTGRGFLEDAVTSGFEIAVEHFGAKVPFEVDSHPDPLDSSEGPCLDLGMKEHFIRTVLCLVRVYVLVFEIAWILLGALGFPVSEIGAIFGWILSRGRVLKS